MAYHIELRHFPRNFNRFNLTGAEIGTIALTWAEGKVLVIDDQKWNPAEAELTIIEGPELPLDRLTMGRGWTAAQREGEEVTERVLAEAREHLRGAQAGAPAAITAPGADPLAAGVELAGLLGPEAARLLGAWRAVAGRSAGLTPSEALALAEREIATGA